MTLGSTKPSDVLVEADGRDPDGGVRESDHETFSQLCDQHGDRRLRQEVAWCGDLPAAEDLVQETLLGAWRGRSKCHGGCQYFTWLCSILLHRHQNARRRRQPWSFSRLFAGERQHAEAILASIPDLGGTPGARAQNEEKAVRVLRSLEALPRKQRQVVYLRFCAGDSLEGIAAAVGCPVGTVKSRLFHGLERLRRMKTLQEENDP